MSLNFNDDKNSEFNVEYLNHHARGLIYSDYLMTMYQDGKVVEAFSILYGNLEQFSRSLWANVLINYFGKGNSISSFEYKFKHDWELAHLMRILHELGIISDNEVQHFTNFKKGRNEVVHVLPTVGNLKIKRKQLDFQFKEGIKAFELLREKINLTKPEIDRIILGQFGDLLKAKVKTYGENMIFEEFQLSKNPLHRFDDIER